MAYLLYIEFPSEGPFGSEAATAYADLAADIAAEDSLIWKLWTENAETATAGGVYLFTAEASADRYLAKHTKRLAGFGITEVTAKGFDVNLELSTTTRAYLGDR